MANENQQLTKYVHQGEVLRRVGDLQVTIAVDPNTMRKLGGAMERLRQSLVGRAVVVPRCSLIPADERNIIDIEAE